MAEFGRAAVFLGVGRPFELREYPVPDPAPGDLVLQVTRTNVCGSDLHMWRGDLDLAGIGAKHAVVFGHEMVGKVARLGAGVTRDALGKPLAPGDPVAFAYYTSCGRCLACLRGQPHVCAQAIVTCIRNADEPPHFLGGCAEYYYAYARQAVFKLAPGLDPALAAGANCAVSQVIWGLEQAGLKLGETVVVQGAGGLGLLACAVARDMGAAVVVAVDGVPARLALARRFGADEVIDLREVPSGKDRVARVKALTGGWGADVVVEVVGHPSVIPEGVRMLGRGGRYLELGNISTHTHCELDPALLVTCNRALLGVSLYPPDVLRRALGFLERRATAYPFAELMGTAYPLEAIDQAFRDADAFGADAARVTRASLVPTP